MQLNKTNYPVGVFDTDVGITGAGVVATSPVIVHRLEQFSGADPTGTNDSAAAINTALALGGEITAAPGSVFKIASSLLMNVAKTKFSGNFTINSTSALAEADMITITGNDCIVEGLRLANPTFSQTKVFTVGGKNVGIRIQAHRCSILSNALDGFQNSIMVDPGGEYYDSLIAFNRCTNCIGAGDGPAGQSTNNGEDRGDGIVNWGARTRIIGNWVQAKSGEDCRIGIHTEALPGSESVAGTDPDSCVVIVGNIVKGSFRRGIISEEVSRIVIANNIVAGGQTWWGIGVMAATDAIVEGNNVTYDRATTDLSGNYSFNGNYCGIYVQSSSAILIPTRVIVANNNVVVTVGGGRGILLQGWSASPTVTNFISFIGNNVTALVSTAYIGFGVSYATDVELSNNVISGPFTKGIWAWDMDRLTIVNNRIDGCSDWGISLEQNSTEVDVSGNKLHSTNKGIQGAPITNFMIINNYFSNVTNRGSLIETWGSTQIQVHGNFCAENDAGVSFGGGATKYSMYNNVGFTTDVRIALASLQAKANWINTWDKYPGKLVSCADGKVYMANGTTDVSTWIPTTSGTPVTPA